MTFAPQILTYCCDEITTTLIREESALRTDSVANLADKNSLPKNLDPMVVVIDGAVANLSTLESSLANCEAVWPYCARFVLVSAFDDETMENAFSLGASDILRKPLRPREFMARLRVRLKDITALRGHHEIVLGDIVINTRYRMIICRETTYQLSQLSFDVLMQLAEVPNLVVPRAELKRRAWGALNVAEGSLDRQMHELRKGLEIVGSELEIRSVYGSGYLLNHTHKSENET